MNGESNGYTLSDIAAVTNGTNGRNNPGLGEGNGAWWIILFLIFAFMGIGNNGWGNNGNNGTTFIPVGGFGGFGGGTDTFASLQRQLDNAFSNLNAETNQIQQGISSGFYNTNTNLLTSSANTNANICNGFADTNANIASANANLTAAVANGLGATNLGIANGLANVNSNIDRGIADTQRQICQSTDAINANINTNGYETRLLGVNLVSSLNQCCCDVKERLAADTCAVTSAIKDTNYNMSMNNNALLQALNTSTRDLIDNNNANYRALHDEIIANRIEDKNATIAQLRDQLNMQNLAASQAAQNNYLVNQLRPCPIPAYLTCSPYYSYQGNCGCNNGCNCGNA